jgi:hypothetical protein
MKTRQQAIDFLAGYYATEGLTNRHSEGVVTAAFILNCDPAALSVDVNKKIATEGLAEQSYREAIAKIQKA